MELLQRRTGRRSGALALIGILAAALALIAALWTSGAIFAQEQPTPGTQTETAGEQGLLVAGTDPDGPAAKAGVVRGDILLSIDGKQTNTFKELYQALEGRHAGDKATLVVRHGDEQGSLVATLDEHYDQAYLGIETCEHAMPAFPMMHEKLFGEHGGAFAMPFERFALPFGEAFSLTLPLSGTHQAIIVGEVVPDGPADQAGLVAGSAITAIGDSKPAELDELKQAMGTARPGDTLTLSVIAPGESEERTVTVTLGAHPDDQSKAYLGINGLGMIISGHAGEIPQGMHKAFPIWPEQGLRGMPEKLFRFGGHSDPSEDAQELHKPALEDGI